VSTGRHEWHLDPDLAGRYAGGRLTAVAAASVEQHVVACGPCQALLTPTVDAARLDRVFGEIVERVEDPRAGLIERLLRRLGLDEGTARLVAVTPSLRGSWFTGVVLVLGLAVLAAHSGPNGVALFVALAPVLPVLGVALTFGPAGDPAHEMVAATPYSSVRLLAARSAVVVATTVALALPAALLLPGSLWLAVTWLLPALALTLGTLALATRVDPLHAALALSLVWVAIALPGLARHRDPLLAVHPTVQLISALALAAAVAVLVLRRDRLPETLRRIS
jgi:hypothetical protein